MIDAKRVLDLLIAGTAVLVLWPVLLIIGALVKLDSRGPVLFRQERVGRAGRRFRIHKFRTMRVANDGALITASGDSRITRVGALLRRTKLDELPQLIDVIVGDMSLVGPRPEVPHYVEMWPPADREVILSVRPGITDPASIKLRNESDELAAAADPEAFYVQVLLPRKTTLYVEYVRTQSLRGDLRFIRQTLRTVVRD